MKILPVTAPKDRTTYENRLYQFLKETKEQFLKITEEVTNKISRGFKR